MRLSSNVLVQNRLTHTINRRHPSQDACQPAAMAVPAFARLPAPLPKRWPRLRPGALRRPRRLICTAHLTHATVPPSLAGKRHFVVLSDLHVKRDTLQTCLQALQIAHDEALRRDAAVLFLGDFWHARGNLPVEPLNAVLTHLARWQVPVIMIPGNHDLVSRSGYGVSLVPLATTLADRCMLITTPTICLDALFLPYMHDTSALKAVLLEAAHLPNPVRAVFCHAEIAGARLADRFISASSSRSLQPTDFPTSTPVYSGHIHRPHTVSGTIRYVGSPYQVSASEQGQPKSLLVLDCTSGWNVVDSIPIDIGARHFIIRPETPYIMPHLRPGDKVTVQTVKDRSEFAQTLRERGVRVEVQTVANSSLAASQQAGPFAPVEPRISPGNLSNLDLFRQYASIKNLSEDVTHRGIEILQEVDGRTSSMFGKDVAIHWDSVSMRGFGTFLQPLTYSLSDRGLVLVTGRDCDESGAITGRTNATGKTTLVMAALWAMTGRTDARPDGSVEKGVALEMVHDEAKDCEVKVSLQLEGDRAMSAALNMFTAEERTSFKSVLHTPLDVLVTRTSKRNGTGAKSRSYKQGLCLQVNGVDLSCLDVRETQSRIDQLVDGTLLPHTVFFGQHMGAGRGLLDSTDRALKDHLALIFPLDIWMEARRTGRTRLASIQEKQITSEASLDAAKAVVARLETAEALAKEQWATFEAERRSKILQIKEATEAMIASRSRLNEDSVAFAESFAVSRCAGDLVPVIEDMRRSLDLLDQKTEDKLHISRASAAAELARREEARKATDEFCDRVSMSMLHALEWEQQREARLDHIKRYITETRSELDSLASAADMDAEWKQTVTALRACDEKLQELVGVSIREVEAGKNITRFTNALARLESARKKAAFMQEEKIKLQTSLHEIRRRLMASETFSSQAFESLKEELAAAPQLPSRDVVTCDKCLRPFDGALYEEARQGLHVEARTLEEKISAAERDRIEELREYENAAALLSGEVEDEKVRIVQEKKHIAERLGVLRSKRDLHTTLSKEVADYNARRDSLSLETNMYLKELPTELFPRPRETISKTDLQETLVEVRKHLQYQRERSRLAVDKARANMDDIIARIRLSDQESRDNSSKKDEIRQEILDLQRLHAELTLLEKEEASLLSEANPHEATLKLLSEELQTESSIEKKRKAQLEGLCNNIVVMKAIDTAFGPRGVPSFVLEEGLTYLEKLMGKYLHELSAGEIMLQLRGFSDYKSSSRVDGENKEVISKRIFVRKPGSAELYERSLRQLSGGQRRRCSFSFALAFASLAHERAGFQSSMIIFDEILQSLDQDGRIRVAQMIRRLLKENGGSRDTVIVVAQDEAPEISGHAYGGVDVVERKLDSSILLPDGKTAN